MFSDEYTKLQADYVGNGAIFVAKTKAFMRLEIEDKIVIGQLQCNAPISADWNNMLTPRRLANTAASLGRLSHLIFAVGILHIMPLVFLTHDGNWKEEAAWRNCC